MLQHKAAFKKEAAGKKKIILNTCCTDIVEQPPRSFQD
jgi:hypothetical protein